MATNPYFENIKCRFGFGLMRLPVDEAGEIDDALLCRMVDTFLEKGFNYFDTAHGYMNGRSEGAVYRCLASRHPRESFVLTDKLTTSHFQTAEDIRPLILSELEICGVEYFDFFFMHALNKTNYPKFRACRACETALELKAEGKIRHFGISFHDTPDVLEQILTDYPEIEVVQIQLNYQDMEAPAVRSRECLEVCRKFGKPVIVMEPLRGGALVNLPEDCKAILEPVGGKAAELAFRFAAGFEGVMMVLSGMSNLEVMEENLAVMADPQPLSEAEMAALEQVRVTLESKKMIPCTNCRYCVDGCPQKILIPDLFSCMNIRKQFGGTTYYYDNAYTGTTHGKAGDCIGCGLCEEACPQKLPIRALLEEVSAEFDKK